MLRRACDRRARTRVVEGVGPRQRAERPPERPLGGGLGERRECGLGQTERGREGGEVVGAKDARLLDDGAVGRDRRRRAPRVRTLLGRSRVRGFGESLGVGGSLRKKTVVPTVEAVCEQRVRGFGGSHPSGREAPHEDVGGDLVDDRRVALGLALAVAQLRDAPEERVGQRPLGEGSPREAYETGRYRALGLRIVVYVEGRYPRQFGETYLRGVVEEQ